MASNSTGLPSISTILPRCRSPCPRRISPMPPRWCSSGRTRCERLAARGGQLRDVVRRKQVRKFAERLVVLADIVPTAPRSRRRHRRPAPSRCAAATARPSASASASSIRPASASRSSVAFSSKRCISSAHSTTSPSPPIGKAARGSPGDRHDAAIDLRRERPVDRKFGLAGGLALLAASNNRGTGI